MGSLRAGKPVAVIKTEVKGKVDGSHRTVKEEFDQLLTFTGDVDLSKKFAASEGISTSCVDDLVLTKGRRRTNLLEACLLSQQKSRLIDIRMARHFCLPSGIYRKDVAQSQRVRPERKSQRRQCATLGVALARSQGVLLHQGGESEAIAAPLTE